MWWCAVLVCALFPICAWAAPAPAAPLTFQGQASWYGLSAHGKQTASGALFNRYDFSAAHKKLPFGVVLRVHNVHNGEHVLVVVNDRGPFVRGRVVDVSKQAAYHLGMLKRGVAAVWCEVVSDRDGIPLQEGMAYYIQYSLHAVERSAKQYQKNIALRLGRQTIILHDAGNPTASYSVCSGPWQTFTDALESLRKLPVYYSDAEIVLANVNTRELPVVTVPSISQSIDSSRQKQSASVRSTGRSKKR